MGVPDLDRPLRRDAAVNRQQILDAAGRLMAERGLATPLEDIAAAAGVGIATLYRRFPTRASLVEALFMDRLQAYLDDLETALAMDDGWEALVWFLQVACTRQIADRALSELIDAEADWEVASEVKTRIEPMAQTLIRRAKATGRLRADCTLTDLLVIQHMVVSAGAATAALGDAWKRYFTLVVDGLMASRQEPTRPARRAVSLAALKDSHRRC